MSPKSSAGVPIIGGGIPDTVSGTINFRVRKSDVIDKNPQEILELFSTIISPSVQNAVFQIISAVKAWKEEEEKFRRFMGDNP